MLRGTKNKNLCDPYKIGDLLRFEAFPALLIRKFAMHFDWKCFGRKNRTKQIFGIVYIFNKLK